MPDRPTFIDLFCGCGGFTLGMLRAGFDCKAAIDSNTQAIATLRANLQAKSPTNLPSVGFALEADLTTLTPQSLAAIIGTQQIDVIVGGPPCQGFSTARQRDGSNHGSDRLKEDPRRNLFRNFLDHVEHFQPKVFIIENVLGLRSAAGGRYFTAVQHESRIVGQSKGLPGYRVHSQIEHGEKLGSPQKRRRQLIVGVRADLPGYFPSELQPASRASVGAMLGDAIMDLPELDAGDGSNLCHYDIKQRTVFIKEYGDRGRDFLLNTAEALPAGVLHNHVSRPHSDRDLGDFSKLAEGQSSAELLRAGVEFDSPYDKSTFKDRYTRQHRDRLCSTIVAHLSKDGLMFIHPTQNRSLTPREAARVQTFPDWYVFPEPRTHSFRLIGNAVPPLIGEAVGDAILRFLELTSAPAKIMSMRTNAVRGKSNVESPPFLFPSSQAEAVEWLNPLTTTDRKFMRAMTSDAFLKSWHALLWLFPDLHPENALEHGNDFHDVPTCSGAVDKFARRYTRSGWPMVLESFGVEAWRRFKAKEFSDEMFYCVAAQRAGMSAHPRAVRFIRAGRATIQTRDKQHS